MRRHTEVERSQMPFESAGLDPAGLDRGLQVDATMKSLTARGYF